MSTSPQSSTAKKPAAVDPEQPAAIEQLDLDLRSPGTAALLAWLVPGAGHIYQRRYGKGMLFMVCILSTWFFGLALGEGRTVYASNRTIGRQLVYGCQLGVGLAATPALIQARLVAQDQPPKWGGLMAPPMERGHDDELSEWNFKYGAAYDMGVLYTMVAGLLNILAIFDAFAGPMLIPADDSKKRNEAGTDTSPSSAPAGTS